MTVVQASTNVKIQDSVNIIPNKEIVLDLSNPTTILFTIAASGENSQRVLHEGVFSLTKGLVYKLPITNKTLSSKNNFGVKLELDVSDNLRVLNVDSGIVSIESIIHGYIISNNQLLGALF